jgi:hypothetical protein
MDKENLKKRGGSKKYEIDSEAYKKEQDAALEKLLMKHSPEEDSEDELPYGGKVYLARRRKPDSWACIAFQVTFGFYL